MSSSTNGWFKGTKSIGQLRKWVKKALNKAFHNFFCNNYFGFEHHKYCLYGVITRWSDHQTAGFVHNRRGLS